MQRLKLARRLGEYTHRNTRAWPATLILVVFVSSVLAAALTAQEVLIQKSGGWRYSNGETQPDASWNGPKFDDSSWKSGAAPLGYGGPDHQTEVPNTASPRPVTAYFRTKFEVADPRHYFDLEAELLVDDGAVVYLNGNEIYRANMPRGKVGADTAATASVDDAPGFQPLNFFVSPMRHLVAGTNVLAVEVHQDKAGSEDMIFAFTLSGVAKEFDPSTGGIQGTTKKEIFADGSTWKYRDLRTAPSDDWNLVDFDDSAWKAGAGPLGYGDNDISSLLDYGGDPDNKPITVWLRKEFTLDDPLAANLLHLSFFRDDGAIIYLNGTELLRSNMPPGYVDALTPAKSFVNGGSERKRREFSLEADALVEGKNVIAVEIHQKDADSSDLGFDMSLDIEFLPAGMKRHAFANNATTGDADPAEKPQPINLADPAAVAKAQPLDWRVTGKHLLDLALKAHSAGQLKDAVRNYYPSRWADVFSRRGFGIDPALKVFLLDPKQAAVSQEFFDLLGQFDDQPKVFEIMNRCFRGSGESFREYPKLALAIALVYDQRPPRGWPHHQVSSTILPRRLPDVVEALNFWVETDKRGKSLHPVNSLTIEELKYVVDTPIPFSELKEAQKLRVRLTDFGRLYSGIDYVHKRANENIHNWPHDSYTLPDIKEHGGICVDQAYYSSQIAKAHGVPSMVFSGSGNSGNHAWVGFLDRRGQWNFEVGRYPESLYVTGETHDPQTWRRPTDHEIALLSERYRNTSKYRVSRIHALFAEQYLIYGQLEAAIKASESAIAAEDRNLPAWETLIKARRAARSTPAQMDQLYEDGAKAFRNYADLEASFLRRLSASLEQQGKADEAEKLRSRIMYRNRRERPDLALEEAKKELEKARKTESPDDQLTLYKRHVTRFKDAGLIAYYGLVDPFLKRLTKDGKKDLARDALKYTQKRLKSKDDSTLTEELNKWEQKLEDD